MAFRFTKFHLMEFHLTEVQFMEFVASAFRRKRCSL